VRTIVFVADEVLAKHDENYMPPDAAYALLKGKDGIQVSAKVDRHPMIAELGNFALMLALSLALCRAVCRCRRMAWQSALDRAGAAGGGADNCLFVVFAFASLVYAFVGNDFSVAYVAAQFQFAAAGALPRGCHVGRA
jgi:hypothetical protein